MSEKKLIDAIGDIEDQFIEEYASYNAIQRRPFWKNKPFQISAACAAIVLLIGFMGVQFGKVSLPPEDKSMMANKEQSVSETPETSAPIAFFIPKGIDMESNNQANENNDNYEENSITDHSHANNQSLIADKNINDQSGADKKQTPENRQKNGAQTPVSEENRQPQTEQESCEGEDASVQPDTGEKLQPEDVCPSASQSPVITTNQPSPTKTPNKANWQMITANVTPYTAGLFSLLEDESYEGIITSPPPIQYPELSSPPQTTMEPTVDQTPSDTPCIDEFTTPEPNSTPDSNPSRDSAYRHASAGWGWYNEIKRPITKVDHVEKEEENGDQMLFSRCVSNDEEGNQQRLYLYQIKTSLVSSLTELNILYPEEVFDNAELSYLNGDVYLAQSQDGRLYARKAINNILVTVWADHITMEEFLDIVADLVYVE